VAAVKAVILAAGRGTRLKPLTDARSKPMLPLANQPLISYPLQKLLCAGIYDIGIVVGDNEDELRAGLAHVPAELSYIRQDEPRGLAHAVLCAESFTGDDEFILLFCDNLFSEPLALAQAEWTALSTPGSGAAAMIHVIEVEDPRAFGVAVVDGDGWVQELEEKPKQPKSNLAVVGIDFLTPRIFDAIPRISPSARGELEITDAIGELVAMGHRVRARQLSGFWYDTGTIPDLLDVLQPVMDEFGVYQTQGSHPGSTQSGPVGIARGAVVEGCQLTGPVLIGGESRLLGCQLGPYVAIGAHCVVEDCTLAHCQLYPGTHLSGATDSWSIYDGSLRVGRNAPPTPGGSTRPTP
jgi:glucose-1-phosphate thymidylyltransferase